MKGAGLQRSTFTVKRIFTVRVGHGWRSRRAEKNLYGPESIGQGRCPSESKRSTSIVGLTCMGVTSAKGDVMDMISHPEIRYVVPPVDMNGVWRQGKRHESGTT